jgi:hypothetical protein
VVAAIDEALVGNIDLAICIERVSIEFSDRPEAFHAVRSSVQKLECFALSHVLREKVRTYLAGCDTSDVPELEAARAVLIDSVKAAEIDPSETANREIGYAWDKFHRLYVDSYSAAHKIAESVSESRTWLEALAGRERWARFLAILACPPIKERFGKPFREQLRRLKNFQCTDDPSALLALSPKCRCSFKLSDANALERLSIEANRIFDEAFWYFERLVIENVDEIRAVIDQNRIQEKNRDGQAVCSSTIALLDSGASVSDLPEKELDALVACLPSITVDNLWHPAAFGSGVPGGNHAFHI